MSKKNITPDDVKSDEIDKIIDRSFYGDDDSGRNAFFKLLTFILMFCLYIYLSFAIDYYMFKLLIIIFGLVFLVFIFQGVVIPSFKRKKRNII